MSFSITLKNLSGSNWYNAAIDVEEALRDELLGTKGIIKAVKASDEAKRKLELEALARTLSSVQTLNGLDSEVQKVTNGWLEINKKYANKIFFDYWNEFRSYPSLPIYPSLADAVSFMDSSTNSDTSKSRLTAILGKVVNSSQSQSAKSNAGTAGETLVRSVLQAAGLKKDIDFREQFKSKKGSDTDFVIPNVADYQDYDLEVLIAVQFSSNDRTRLSSSELKSGGQAYVVTGNGLSASTKKLKDIGWQIVAQLYSDNVRIVCYKPEIDIELNRLRAKIAQLGENATDEDEQRLAYFSSHAISYEDFAKKLKARYVK